jgi:hypothetical protein
VTVKLYNVHLDDNTALVHITIDSYLWAERRKMTLDEQITAIREAVEGLDNPSIEAESLDPDESPYIVVTGRRTMTPDERNTIVGERDKARRFHDYMRAFPG